MAPRAAELRKSRRHSGRAAPVEAGMLALFGGVVWLTRGQAILHSSALLAAAVTALALLGDLINIAYCSLRLRRQDD
jgi:hypothetical protein